MAKKDKYVWYNEMNKLPTSEIKEIRNNFLKIKELPIANEYIVKCEIILNDRGVDFK